MVPNTKLLKKSTVTEHARGTQHKAKCCVGCGGCEDCKGCEDMTFVVMVKENAAGGATTLFWQEKQCIWALDHESRKLILIHDHEDRKLILICDHSFS